MQNSKTSEVMVKEVSALNTFWVVQYLGERHSSLDLQELIEQIAQRFPCYVENLETGKVEQVSLNHLQMPRHWFSHRFVKALYDLIQEHIPDPRLGYKIGSSLYRAQPIVRTALGVSLLGTHRMANRVSKEAAKYNRTKQYQIHKLGKGLVNIRITLNPGIVAGEFIVQYNAGCFASYARLAGATDISVDVICIDPGPDSPGESGRGIWDFKLRYQEPGLLTRLTKAVLLNFPWIRAMAERAEIVETEHQEQIFNRDTIIRERTEHLLSIQQKLIDEERENIEQKLQKISLELVTTEERERRAIAEDLHDSVTQLLALSLSRVKSTQQNNSGIDELEEVREYLEQAVTDLRSLTFQISPPVLYDFGLEAALEWLVTEVNGRQGMRLVFSNLLDSPLNPGQAQKVTLYRALRELVINMVKHSQTKDGQILLRQEDGIFVAEVADEGIGFDPDTLKPGFGLFSLEDRLLCLNGKMTILSAPGEGTIVQLSMPLEQIASDQVSGITVHAEG